jgi:cyanate permease
LSKAGLIIGLAPLVGLIASPAAGLLSGKLGLRRPFLIGAGVLFIISGFGSFLVHNEPLIYISVIGLGISQWVFIPMIFIVATELPGKTPSEVAVVLSAGLAVGKLLSFMGPLLVGVTTDAFGSYLPSFSVLAVLPILMILSGFMLPETGPRNGTPAQFI